MMNAPGSRETRIDARGENRKHSQGHESGVESGSKRGSAEGFSFTTSPIFFFFFYPHLRSPIMIMLRRWGQKGRGLDSSDRGLPPYIRSFRYLYTYNKGKAAKIAASRTWTFVDLN